jgi:arylsulfatase A-like enzyme
VPLTLPSHASILTGIYPIAHGIRDNGAFRLAPVHRTLASLFHDRGYRTGAFVGSFPLDSRFGLDQGFEVYDDVNGEGTFYDIKIAEAPDEVLAAAAWIEKPREIVLRLRAPTP